MTKITALTELSTLVGADLLLAVDDVAGTPTTKKLLVSTLLAYVQSNLTFSGVTFANAGLAIYDTNASHTLTISPGSDLTANRTLTLTTGDADRTIVIDGGCTLDDWFDQSVKTTAGPTFDTIKLNDSDDSHTFEFVMASNATANRTITITTGDADRAITLSGNLTVEAASLVNQDLTSDASPQFASIGCGTAAPASNKSEVLGTAYPVFRGTRTTTSTNASVAALDFLAKTSNNMADGFGGGITASVQDDTAGPHFIAGFYGIRSGADNSGSFAIYTSSAGSWAERVRVTPAGNVLIGHSTLATTMTKGISIQAGTAPTVTLTDIAFIYVADANGAGTAAPHFFTEAGNVIKLYRQSALTAKDAGTSNSGDATTDGIIDNNRTRIEEIETILSNLGLIP